MEKELFPLPQRYWFKCQSKLDALHGRCFKAINTLMTNLSCIVEYQYLKDQLDTLYLLLELWTQIQQKSIAIAEQIFKINKTFLRVS